ncbi:MAG: hypothetical protein ACP5VE_09590 [Chthonomonadales bacterium]
MKPFRFALTMGLTLLVTAALAVPSMLAVFKGTYKNIPKGSALDKAACETCHVGHTPKLNPYGEDIKKALTAAKSKKLTPEILKKVENLDSDKDGVKNINEIKKGTLPGDPKSK